MSEPPTVRGHLTPGRHATVVRLPAPDDVAHLVRQLWIPEWDLPAGERVEQLVLGYPASNVVVEPDGVALHGPTTRAATRVLTGRGWAVGALLRPAGVLLFTDSPARLLDRSVAVGIPDLQRANDIPDPQRAAGAPDLQQAGGTLDLQRTNDIPDPQRAGGTPDLQQAVAEAMELPEHAGRHERAGELLLDHVRARAKGMPAEALRDGLLANRMVDLIEAGVGLRSPAELARELNVSERSLQRLAARFVGMPPGLLLRRRRLQEAAERMRADPATDLGALAAELGFADQSHLTRQFRAVLGSTPRGYGRV